MVPAPPALGPDDVEELRLALVMNGGVSLAVWIGGVASEINRVVRRQDAYGELLRATGTEARVDVISGASAGGINGALLALASVCDADLAPLRDVWLNQGALEDLLRSAVESDPPSLLRGNDYFLVELRRAFAAVRRSGRAQLLDPAAVPIELNLTTTLLHGNPNTVPDDFGTVIADVSHRARFCFRRGPDVGYDAFDDERIAERLAFAARATASFPVAFEPLFYPADHPDAVGAPGKREARNIPESRFLLDGGILDNKPLESAVEAIFAQRAEREVRRILAYVVPNPGASAWPEPDDPRRTPDIAQVALASLMELPSVESISAQIDAVLRQNRLVRRKHQNRAGVMMLGLETVHALAQRLFPVYRKRRLESSTDYLLPVVSAELIERTKGRQALGRRLRDWMMARFLAVADEVPWAPTVDPLDPRSADERTHWRWGVFALENMADMMLDVLSRTLRLTTPVDANRAVRTSLRALRRRAFDLFREVRVRRADDGGFWRAQSDELVGYFAEAGTAKLTDEQVTDWIVHALQAWSGLFPEDARQSLGALALDIARVVAEAGTIFRTHLADGFTWPRAEDRAAHETLRQHFDVLTPAGGTVDDVLRNLLAVEVVLNAFGSYRDVRDQYVELLQVSADVPTSFGGPDAARDKLAGAQLANFGAFLKRSWRANDWMFGRLDGAERLSRILLNPDRLRQLYSSYAGLVRHGGAVAALDVIHALAVTVAERPADAAFLESLWQQDLDRIASELAYLNDPNVPVPEQLPICAAAVTRRLHLDILRAELPVVAEAVEHDLARGGAPRCYGADFALAMDQAIRSSQGQPVSPETIVAVFRRCRIGRERIAEEVGSDLVTSIASRTLAVTVAAGAGKHANLGPVRRVFQAGRVPAIAFDFLAQGLVARSRTMIALFTAALTSGATLLLLGLAYIDSMPGVLRTTAAVLVVATMAVAFLRHHKLAALATLLGGALMVVAMGPDWFSLEADRAAWLRIGAVAAFLALVCVLAFIVGHGPRQRFVWRNPRRR